MLLDDKRLRQIRRTTIPPDLTFVSEPTWRRIDAAVENGLAYLKSHQRADGVIPTMDVALPTMTSLYVMAAISAGHEPGSGDYGASIDRAIDYVLSVQRDDGLLAQPIPSRPRRPQPSRHTWRYTATVSAA